VIGGALIMLASTALFAIVVIRTRRGDAVRRDQIER
jgi:hypothetical protein